MTDDFLDIVVKHIFTLCNKLRPILAPHHIKEGQSRIIYPVSSHSFLSQPYGVYVSVRVYNEGPAP